MDRFEAVFRLVVEVVGCGFFFSACLAFAVFGGGGVGATFDGFFCGAIIALGSLVVVLFGAAFGVVLACSGERCCADGFDCFIGAFSCADQGGCRRVRGASTRETECDAGL